MGKIHELPTVVINQIAAGEVIARPASAVKELSENAIDADATRVRIEIDNECRNITVVDDGEGMSPEDAMLAIERHATSKIRDTKDLATVVTRGFRGEALASISAVSRVEVLTRRREDVAGYRIAIEGGVIQSKGPVGCAPGTTIRIRDLFFNTPPRRKFLKRESSEFSAIMQTLTRQMLACGDIGFTIVRNGKKLIELPSDQPLGPRMVHLLGNLAESQLIKINTDRHGVRVYGYVTRPEAARKDRREQYFFVNNRPVVHRSMGYSLGQAYHGLLINGRFPVCCLFVDVPPQEIDVNVHPTKEEIRFVHESKATGVLNRAVAEALRAADLTPRMRLDPNEGSQDGVEQLKFQPESLRYPGSTTLPPPEAPRFNRPAENFSDFPWEKRPDPTPDRNEEQESAPSPTQAGEDVVAMAAAETREDPMRLTHPRPLGQAGDTYVIATLGDDLLIVDQHAAHERINFTRIMKIFDDGGADTQPLLVPITFDIPAADMGRIETLTPLLERVGVEIEHFGGQTYLARSVPAALPDIDVVGFIHDLLSEDRDTSGARNALPHEKLAITMACHASIKANQKLSAEEARVLLNELLETPGAYTCPHGRPTMIRLTRDQLDKQFKRT